MSAVAAVVYRVAVCSQCGYRLAYLTPPDSPPGCPGCLGSTMQEVPA
jgi:hypothetical protein